MSTDLSALFSRFQNLHILVVGDIMADAYIKGKVERISPEAPVPVLHTNAREIRLGGAANVALNLKSLGLKVSLCSMIGQDEMGQKLVELLQNEGIETSYIYASKRRPTTVKTRIMAGSQHLLRLDDENDAPTYPEEMAALLPLAHKAAENVDAIIFEDYDKGMIFPELIEAIVHKASNNKTPVLVDPKKRNFSHYKGVQLFKPNLKELKEGLHIEVNPREESSIQAACEKVAKHLGCRGVLLTLSEFGMSLWQPGYFLHTPARKRKIADVSGAGDTVISVAAACMAAGADAETVVQLSNLAGGLVCEFSGVVPIDKEQLLKEAKENWA